jgi:hypothetical protein
MCWQLSQALYAAISTAVAHLLLLLQVLQVCNTSSCQQQLLEALPVLL